LFDVVLSGLFYLSYGNKKLSSHGIENFRA